MIASAARRNMTDIEVFLVELRTLDRAPMYGANPVPESKLFNFQ
jgi:hypothetical protein